MSDITELAQSLKAAAIDAKELAIIARYSKGRAAAEKFYALANPNNVIALVEALEKAQQRISRLESRTVTVKLASRRLPSDYVDGEFGNDDLAAIHNACRLECKVSVEKYLSAHGIVVKWEDE
ncbi:ead/Ea22-like family protein [Klebsiella pneumoniae]|uniref:ead/Ea22-like family protein n=1 Tax=Klebsiella pneumoniae TaxID=573 RepID=UPI00207360C3|nr:ead/Ea22-like family protein [Klebsiella pneumoniae]HDU6162419.1 ead/Ea22-like family protein [Klebsiella pneumoniae subsp. pneumoniae]